MKRDTTRALLATSTLLAGIPHAAAADEPARVIVQGSRDAVDPLVTQVHVSESDPLAGQSLAGLAEHVANFHLDSGGAGSFGDLLTLRGLSNTPYFSDPAVTIYVDDIPLTGGFTNPSGLFGFFDASLLRGPSGTAFGRAGQGGVLLLSSGDLAAAERPEASVRAGAGNFSAHTASLLAHTAGGEALAGSLAISHSARDGYIRNTQIGERVDDQESSTLAARGIWRAGNSALLSLQVLANRQRLGAQPLVPFGGPYFTVEREKEGRTDVDFTGAAFKGEFETRIGRLTSTTSFTDADLNPYENHVVLPPALDALVQQRQRAWNEEIHLFSPGEERKWNLGAWFSSVATDGTTDRALTNLFPIEASSFDIDSRSAAVFGEWETALAAKWRLVAGLRAETTRREFTRDETVPQQSTFSDRKTFNAVLPKLGVQYVLSATTSVSATASRGYKPGGWSAYTGNEALAPFDAESANAFELALSSAPSEALRVTLRGFVFDIHDYQIERSFNAADYLVVNAPRARSIGAELEGTWRITSTLTLSSALGVTRATLREFTDPFTGDSFDGNRTPYAPDYDASLAVSYGLPRGWFASFDVASAGRTFYDESESTTFSQRSRTTLGARTGYERDRWHVTLYGENLTDERYYSLVVPGIAHAVPAAPRTWGVEVGVRIE